MKQKIIVLTGPTASGKTKLSIQLAKKIDAEIICADSRIVYKDINIASAKPTLLEQDGVVHHMIDLLSPKEEFSAGDFTKIATKKINEIYKKNKYVIICGGTWFYIKSLLDDSMLPECKINKELREELSKLDSLSLWEKLNSLDSTRAKQIHPNNKDKIIRSIELCIELNMPISSYQRKENNIQNSIWYMLDTSREELYSRINLRVDDMIKLGLYEEWEQNNLKYGKTKILENTIGYKEFYDLENKIYNSTNEAIEKIKQHTRNFAKRQLTYFKSNKQIKLINTLDDILDDINENK